MILIPFIAAVLYWLGGQYNKWLRWGMGIPIGILGALYLHSIIPLLCIFTYWIATSAFPYGEKSWLDFLREDLKFFVCGTVLGLASFPILHWMSIPQAILSGCVFMVMYDIKVPEPMVSTLRGLIGTIFFIL